MNSMGLLEEMSQTMAKLQNGYDTLQRLETVEVGTTPKTLVWQMDKVKLYRYDRATPAKCKIPVLVSFAIMNRHDVLDLTTRPFIDEEIPGRRT